MDGNIVAEILSPPSRAYLKFCQQYLLRGVCDDLVDPFALEVSGDKLAAAYVEREQVSRELPQISNTLGPVGSWQWQPTVTFVLGKQGAGKSTLMRWSDRQLQRSDVLGVAIFLPSAVDRLVREQPPGPKPEALLRRTLLRHIFGRFWAVLSESERRPAYLAGRRQNFRWMARLRWFYQHLTPSAPQIHDDFELMAWLQTKSAVTELSDDLSLPQQFRELIDLITTPPLPSYGGSPISHFQHVQVLLDSGDEFSQLEIEWIIQEVCRLRVELPDKMYLCLLLDATWKDLVVRAVKDAGDGIACYQLPPWQDSELKELLRLRLIAWGQDSRLKSDWGDLLGEQLTPEARGGFVNTIVGGAQKAKGGTGRDAPVHALWLARWLITGLAQKENEVGHQQAHRAQTQSGTTLEEIKKLVDLYVRAMCENADRRENQ